jgi:hypothetical protein
MIEYGIRVRYLKFENSFYFCHTLSTAAQPSSLAADQATFRAMLASIATLSPMISFETPVATPASSLTAAANQTEEASNTLQLNEDYATSLSISTTKGLTGAVASREEPIDPTDSEKQRAGEAGEAEAEVLEGDLSEGEDAGGDEVAIADRGVNGARLCESYCFFFFPP